MILQQQMPRLRRGDTSGFSLMFDMSILWERYVVAVLRRAARGTSLEVDAQGASAFWRATGVSTRTIRPDVILRNKTRPGEIAPILDTKWKQLEAGGPNESDLRQMFVYGELLRCECTLLLYPGSGGDPRRIEGRFERGGRCAALEVTLVGATGRIAKTAIKYQLAQLVGGALFLTQTANGTVLGHFQERAERVRHPHRLGRVALGLEQVGGPSRPPASHPRRRDVEAVSLLKRDPWDAGLGRCLELKPRRAHRRVSDKKDDAGWPTASDRFADSTPSASASRRISSRSDAATTSAGACSRDVARSRNISGIGVGRNAYPRKRATRNKAPHIPSDRFDSGRNDLAERSGALVHLVVERAERHRARRRATGTARRRREGAPSLRGLGRRRRASRPL